MLEVLHQGDALNGPGTSRASPGTCDLPAILVAETMRRRFFEANYAFCKLRKLLMFHA